MDKKYIQNQIREIQDYPKPGINYKDFSPLLQDTKAVMHCVRMMAEPFFYEGITKVVAVESRGFIFGPMIAQFLNCGFVMARKKGKLPPPTLDMSYELEYGSTAIEIGSSAIHTKDKVLIHDDLLATGGTASAAAKLVSSMGGKISGFALLISLDFLNGQESLKLYSRNVQAVIHYEQ